MDRVFLGREGILAVQDIQVREVQVPEWGCWVRVRGLTGAERDEWEKSILVGKGKDRDVNVRNLRAKLVQRSVVDAEGKLIFTEADVPALGAKSAAALERLFDAARELSGLTEQDEEELLKNSEDGQPGDLLSA